VAKGQGIERPILIDSAFRISEVLPANKLQKGKKNRSQIRSEDLSKKGRLAIGTVFQSLPLLPEFRTQRFLPVEANHNGSRQNFDQFAKAVADR